MDMITLARQLGHEIQKSEKYVQMMAASDRADNDEQLQAMIGEFNLKRLAINNEAQKPEPDQEKMKTLNREMRNAYDEIMEHPLMKEYEEKKDALIADVNRVVAIVTQSAQGEDPDTTDYHEGCGGHCDSCAGCH